MQILGKEFISIPYIGMVTLFLKTLPGFVALIIIPAVLLIALELKNIKREIEKNVERKLLQEHGI